MFYVNRWPVLIINPNAIPTLSFVLISDIYITCTDILSQVPIQKYFRILKIYFTKYFSTINENTDQLNG